MSTNNSSKLTLNDVYKELEKLKINRANVTISQLSKIFNIDLEASTRIHEGLTISNKSMAYDYYDEVKQKVKTTMTLAL